MENRYLFSGDLVLTSALHIGGGDSTDSPVDSAVVKLANRQPYIPGSTLKGIFRSTVEKIAGNLPGVWCCTLYETGGDCLSCNDELADQLKALKVEKAAGDRIMAFLDKHLCETCSLFGSPYQAAKIGLADAMVQESWSGSYEIRDGVGIDRDSERAVHKAKFDYEIVPVGTRFDFRLLGENLSPRDLGLVCIGLTELMAGMVMIGGFTSRGLGRCCLELRKVEYLDFSDLVAVQQYLLTREMKTVDDPDSFLADSIKSLF